MTNPFSSPRARAALQIVTNPGRMAREPAVLADAFLTLKEAQGRPTLPEHLARLQPRHDVEPALTLVSTRAAFPDYITAAMARTAAFVRTRHPQPGPFGGDAA